jgi:hypothetical protein
MAKKSTKDQAWDIGYVVATRSKNGNFGFVLEVGFDEFKDFVIAKNEPMAATMQAKAEAAKNDESPVRVFFEIRGGRTRWVTGVES